MSQARAGRSGADGEPASEPGPEPDSGQPGDAGPGTAQGHGHECLEWCPICRSHELLKGVTSPEIRQQLQSIQNEAMQVFRAFAAAYTERAAEDPLSRDRDAKAPRGGEPDEPVVTDISID
ncbi:MAG: hypothetical protein M3Y23_01330 [Actinomycetota bacterium]|nr:hypothetical protein [Actinomycetota bacterium]